MKKLPKAYWKETSIMYNDLYKSAVNELKFKNLCVDYLMSVLNEVHELGDEMTKAVIENAKNRHELNKIIHIHKTLGDDPYTLTKIK